MRGPNVGGLDAKGPDVKGADVGSSDVGGSEMRVLAVLTARGGSTRIPRKNIRDFCGRPMLAWPLSAALESNLFDEVMVSTDDDEIASVARACGASVPFMRSAAASDDFATTADVIDEVLSCWEERGVSFDVVCCLYPTAPFVTAGELREGLSLIRGGASGVVCVSDFDFPPQRALLLADDGSLSFERPEFACARSQDLPTTVHDCGRFYFTRVDAWREERTFLSKNCRALVIDPRIACDIDTPADWEIAEMKFRHMRRG